MGALIRNVAWEKRQLPDIPQWMTFRGRYVHTDKKLIEYIKLEDHHGSVIRVLDVGCGVLPFGSPTLHDLWDVLSIHGVKPVMVGVDANLPCNIEPTYLDITYAAELNQVSGKFDVVRMLHLVEHLKGKDYNTLRNAALSKLRQGGIFVATQKLESYNPRKEYWSLLPPSIKIAQKVADGIRAITLLPEVQLRSWMLGYVLGGIDLGAYAQHKKNILEGKEKMPLKLALGQHKEVMEHLVYFKPDALDYESMWREYGGRYPGDVYAEHKQKLEDYFSDPRKVVETFWRHHNL